MLLDTGKEVVCIGATVLMLQVIGGIQMPPARYDHKFHGRMIVQWVDYPSLIKHCDGNIHASACTRPGNPCRIYINHGYRGTWAEPQYIRHERAHCNGWSKRHEQ